MASDPSDISPDLPITPVLGDVAAALEGHGLCVLEAPPGAGKTTAVPPYLLRHAPGPGRILMLEPRRVAARAAAERIAHLLGAQVGGLVGYTMRGARKTSPQTRIEVITEGVLTRMVQEAPDLDGVGTLIFDEFHERALQADLGLTLSLDARSALRPDLRILVMSATLDAAPIAAFLGDAPLIRAQGRAFDVQMRWANAPRTFRTVKARAQATAERVGEAWDETEGSILVFLPGKGEIAQVQAALRLPPGVQVLPLHGSLPFAQQRAVLTPSGARRVILATAIAETSLTVPDVRVVVDGGQARRARFDPATGMSRLVTERVTKAEATQRAGRAGRVAPGWAYRMWARAEEGALGPFPPPEISAADLTGLALDLALWGTPQGEGLRFLTPPPQGTLAEAQKLLFDLNLTDAKGQITAQGRRLAGIPAHPRLAHMIAAGGGAEAAALAALAEARGPIGDTADMSAALRDLLAGRAPKGDVTAAFKRLKPLSGAGRDLSSGALLALAYPDRIGLVRPGDGTRYVLSGGTGARLDPADPMVGTRLLVAATLDGDRQEALIRAALPVAEAELRALFPNRLCTQNLCRWSKRHRRIEARTQTRLGALVLSDQNWKGAGDAEIGPALLAALRDLGLGTLPWTHGARRLQARVAWLRAKGADLPDLGDETLLERLETWLLPMLAGARGLDDLGDLDLTAILSQQLSPAHRATLDRLAPASFTAPTGTRLPIDYAQDRPSVQVRLQELFGLTTHPTAGPEQVPITLHLLSPAHRPVQVTADLPGFWRSSYGDVRKDMRSRYPKHDWPENPDQAQAHRGKVRKKGAGA
ncbi:MAG: ATP-dependent helicase HrpB [Pseudomonadota bacterium]